MERLYRQNQKKTGARSVKLWVKILISLVLGVVTGLIMGPRALMLQPIGTIFLNLINMLIVPLVLSSMILGITSIHDPQKLGRIGGKTLLLFITTTAISIAIGLLFAKVFVPGSGLSLTAAKSTVVLSEMPGISDILLSVIPRNPAAAFVEGNVLQIIVFAIFMGVSINLTGDKGRPLLDFFESLSEVMYRLTGIVMELSPLGVFAIMAWVAGSFGAEVLWPLIKFLLVYYSACLLHVLVVFCGMLRFGAKLNPKHFFYGMSDAIMMAFSTCSSSATLPVTMHCTEVNLGVSKNIANFVVPLGSTVNMNGSGIYQGMAVLFIAQAYGIVLDWHALIIIVLTATLSAIGAAGIPGSGFIMLSVVCSSVGIPLEGLALLAGIDRIREMGSTVLNILSDAVCAVCIAKQEGELDERQYYLEELVELEGSDT